jgi:hypothetical protein
MPGEMTQKLLTWLSPWALVTMAAPRPLVTLTLIPPMRLHTPMNHIMFFSPYLPKYRQHESLISKCYRPDSLRAEPENDDQRACDEDADIR